MNGANMFTDTGAVNHENISIFLADEELIEYIRESTDGANSVEVEDLYDIIEDFLFEGKD